MLKSVELWDFESHEHTLIDGLSDGLNVVFGPSNAGKTSVVRALRLVAYNDFDPASLRIGTKACKVRVTTDKGVVQVTRGPNDNLWEIWHGDGSGPATHTLSRPGKAVVPQAAEIVGMGLVKLGDVDVPVNIMEQLETHFMLAGIGDEKATGSVRAQIIDEISGLSGIEGVIKGVSLDNHRAGRKIKESEQQMEELKGHLHDEDELDREGRVLDEAQKHLEEHQNALEAIDTAKALMTEGDALVSQIGGLKRRLAAIPNVKLAEQHLDRTRDALDVVNQATDLLKQADATRKEISRLRTAIAHIPDHAKATRHLERARDALDRAGRAKAILDEVERIRKEVASKQKRLDEITKSSAATKHLKSVEEVLEKMRLAEKTLTIWQSASEEVGLLKRRIKENREVLKEAEEEQDRILRTIKVCPLNPAHPVSEDCLKGLEKPVAVEAK